MTFRYDFSIMDNNHLKMFGQSVIFDLVGVKPDRDAIKPMESSENYFWFTCGKLSVTVNQHETHSNLYIDVEKI